MIVTGGSLHHHVTDADADTDANSVDHDAADVDAITSDTRGMTLQCDTRSVTLEIHTREWHTSE